MISSLDAVKAINDVRADAVVVGTMTPNRYWESVTENPDLDLPIFGGHGEGVLCRAGYRNRSAGQEGAYVWTATDRC